MYNGRSKLLVENRFFLHFISNAKDVLAKAHLQQGLWFEFYEVVQRIKRLTVSQIIEFVSLLEGLRLGPLLFLLSLVLFFKIETGCADLYDYLL